MLILLHFFFFFKSNVYLIYTKYIMSDSVEDFLEVDSAVPGQAYGVFSFLSPENVLKIKELFVMSEFIKYLCDNDEFIKKNLLAF